MDIQLIQYLVNETTKIKINTSINITVMYLFHHILFYYQSRPYIEQVTIYNHFWLRTHAHDLFENPYSKTESKMKYDSDY